MNWSFPAALAALIAATSLFAQTASVAQADPANAPVLPGSWSYSAVTDGSEARFADSAGSPQLFLRCTRSTRQVTIAKPATAAAAFVTVWTTSTTRNIPSSFDPATGRLSASLANFDGLLDAIAFSRAKFAVTVSGGSPLVIPAWAEPQRVIEDCRA